MRRLSIGLFMGMLATLAVCSDGAPISCPAGQTACGSVCLTPGSVCGDPDGGGTPGDGGGGTDARMGVATLVSLTVSVGTLSPVFTPANSTYTLALSAFERAVQVTPTASDSQATILVNGNQVASGASSLPIVLSAAAQMITVSVQAASGGAMQTYGIVVTRTPQTYLKASNTEASDSFAWVAVSGDTVAVGAPTEDSATQAIGGPQTDNGRQDSGAVYVFRRTAGVWAQEAFIKAGNADVADNFGTHVALSGDTLAVGATGEDSPTTGINGDGTANTASNSGAVYVYQRTGTTWAQQAYIKASNTEATDGFGASLALTGDTLAVGATGEDSSATGSGGNQANNGALGSGAVYVFLRTGTTWAQQAYLKASNTAADDNFGVRVSLSGDTLAVGASGEDSSATGSNGNQADNTASAAGAAYVFVRTGTTWAQQAYLKASNTGAGDQFGIRVSLSGDTLAVAATNEASSATGVDGNQANDTAAVAGAVYVFQRTGTSWAQQAYLKASNTDASDAFGFSVSLAGDLLAVGAPGESSSATGIGGNQSDNGAGSSGAVYLFKRTGTAWVQQSYLKAGNAGVGDTFGNGVALADGVLVVGAPMEDGNGKGVDPDGSDNGATSSGAVYLFR